MTLIATARLVCLLRAVKDTHSTLKLQIKVMAKCAIMPGSARQGADPSVVGNRTINTKTV